MKLIPMTDFVLELWDDKLMSEIGLLAVNYAQFLKTPLKLEMFIPCDEKMNILKEPNHYRRFTSKDYLNENPKMSEKWIEECEKFKKAKSKNLFKDFEFFIDHDFEKYVMAEGFVLSIESLYTMKIEDIVDNYIELTRFGISTIHE